MKKTALLLPAAAVLLFTLPQAARAEWSGNVFLGYNQSSGNTDKGSGQADFSASHKTETGDFLSRARAFYSQSNNKMDGQKWDAQAKYLLAFPDHSQWFNSYQVTIDHDRFADIDYRVLPAVGVGYHFARAEDWTWNADLALGFEITRHRANTAADDETAALIAHTFARKRILENAFISEDLTLIPGLENGSGARVKSETAFTNPINEKLDLEIKFTVDYDSKPAQGKTSTDRNIMAGIKYKF
jgi:putative salt-induced outer membrane protein YdiY